MNISIGKAVMLAIVCSVLSALVTAVVLKKPAPVAPVETAAVKPAAETEAEAPAEPAPDIDVEQAMQDRSIGAEDAPVTIIEYASMTCGHCAMFHKNVLPEVKKQLIDTGKARLVFRDMPWDKYAIKAAKMARCAPHDKYFELVGTIFDTQEIWTKRDDPQQGLREMGIAAGMDGKLVDACLESDALTKAVLERQKQARELDGITSTPSFVVLKDGQKLDSYPEFEKIGEEFSKHDHHH